jgi:hypothetical protein
MLLRVGNFDDWPTLGDDVAAFIEAYCCHGPGDKQGDPLVLDVEEIQLLRDLYRLYPAGLDRAGRRLVSKGLYSRAKGRRKSELAGAVVVAEARGPVRFDGWNARGEPVGRPVRGPFIRCLATEESQSGNTYGNVVAMLDYAGARYPDVFGGVDLGQRVQGSTRVFLPHGGEIRPSTASSAAKDGGKESFAVEDEPHLYTTPELRSMDRTITRNLMKRKVAEPWLLRTSTSYRPGQDSVCEEHHVHAEAVIAGRATLAGMYMNHREGPRPIDWEDDGQVMAMLVEAYGAAASWMDLERILHEEIRNPQADLLDSQRFWGNLASRGGEDAFDIEAFRDLAVSDEVPPGELIVLGFDGARFHDATALVASHIGTGYQWPLGVWERPLDAGDDWEVDESDVDAAIRDAFDRYEVWRFYGDPPYWENSMSAWAGRYGDKRVISWWTNRDRPMCYAVAAFTAAIREGSLKHSGDDAVERHVANCRKRPTRVRDDLGKFMHTVRKERPDSERKIDAAMASILSWEARRDAVAAGALTSRRSRRGGTL